MIENPFIVTLLFPVEGHRWNDVNHFLVINAWLQENNIDENDIDIAITNRVRRHVGAQQRLVMQFRHSEHAMLCRLSWANNLV